MMDRTHVVYRCLSATGDLLYVGQTSQLATRCKAHRYASAWWPEVEITITTRPTSQQAARRYERLAIRHERPRYNVNHGYASARPTSQPLPPRDLATTDYWTSREVADDFGVRVQQWHRLVARYGLTPEREIPGLRGAKFWHAYDVERIRQALAADRVAS